MTQVLLTQYFNFRKLIYSLQHSSGNLFRKNKKTYLIAGLYIQHCSNYIPKTVNDLYSADLMPYWLFV
jgi:hypothetical protein